MYNHQYVTTGYSKNCADLMHEALQHSTNSDMDQVGLHARVACTHVHV